MKQKKKSFSKDWGIQLFTIPKERTTTVVIQPKTNRPKLMYNNDGVHTNINYGFFARDLKQFKPSKKSMDNKTHWNTNILV